MVTILVGFVTVKQIVFAGVPESQVASQILLFNTSNLFTRSASL
jgi:hypothetical protein